ncbi:hypothetical protein ACKKBG_A24565 [Auxenochlorella protothecoides x Auxenochlorella symbiontica]
MSRSHSFCAWPRLACQGPQLPAWSAARTFLSFKACRAFLLSSASAGKIERGVVVWPSGSSSSPSVVEVQASSLQSGQPPPPPNPSGTDRWILQWRNASSEAAAAACAASDCGLRFSRVLSGAAARLPRAGLASFLAVHGAALAALHADSTVSVADAHVQSVGGDADQLAAGAESRAGRWGLDRVDQSALPLDGLYHYAVDAATVTVYVVDTGILASHEEFRTSSGSSTSRAAEAYTTLSSGTPGSDCQGHGTHVAGVVGGLSYGVAKGVALRAVRMLDCQGQGLVSDAVAALDWLAANAARPAVVTLSLSGVESVALDQAVAAAVAAGLHVVAAAGNGDVDACSVSPGRATAALIVGASDERDRRLYAGDGVASNYGACVDLFAPGSNIQSAGIASDTASAYRSGTSQAVPFVAGAAALVLQDQPSLAPAAVASLLRDGATKGVLSSSGSTWTFSASQTPNLLLQSLATGVAPPPAGSPPPASSTSPAGSPSSDTPVAGASQPPPPPAAVTLQSIGGSAYAWALGPWSACDADSCLQTRTLACQLATGNGTAVGLAACAAAAQAAGSAAPATDRSCCAAGGGGPRVGVIVAAAAGSAFAIVLLLLLLLCALRRWRARATLELGGEGKGPPPPPQWGAAPAPWVAAPPLADGPPGYSAADLSLPPPPPPINTPHPVYISTRSLGSTVAGPATRPGAATLGV